MYAFVAMHHGRIEHVNVATSLEQLLEPFRLHTNMDWEAYKKSPDSIDPDLYGSAIVEADEVESIRGG
jgi:hypothetical protein